MYHIVIVPAESQFNSPSLVAARETAVKRVKDKLSYTTGRKGMTVYIIDAETHRVVDHAVIPAPPPEIEWAGTSSSGG